MLRSRSGRGRVPTSRAAGAAGTAHAGTGRDDGVASRRAPRTSAGPSPAASAARPPQPRGRPRTTRARTTRAATTTREKPPRPPGSACWSSTTRRAIAGTRASTTRAGSVARADARSRSPSPSLAPRLEARPSAREGVARAPATRRRVAWAGGRRPRELARAAARAPTKKRSRELPERRRGHTKTRAARPVIIRHGVLGPEARTQQVDAVRPAAGGAAPAARLPGASRDRRPASRSREDRSNRRRPPPDRSIDPYRRRRPRRRASRSSTAPPRLLHRVPAPPRRSRLTSPPHPSPDPAPPSSSVDAGDARGRRPEEGRPRRRQMPRRGGGRRSARGV